METQNKKIKYLKWFSADEMHEGSKKWMSELKFIKDEHTFFEDLIKNYTLQLIGDSNFLNIKNTIDELQISKKQAVQLLEVIKNHEKDLELIVDNKNQIEEEKAYKKEHAEIIEVMGYYFSKYKKLKTSFFKIITAVLKKEKQQQLLSS
ncbi:hypothetical protein [Lacinutrix sp. MedPE-SW]|uniref:hypothetical protein n=1 Tax=Lacinutrix sp. MedPE-SW TaxID=1860087 RepID=UPI0009141841|nr:hypothetical protein [Lacinutrix sp. MedPE-SW]OIQ18755.1 MAG: hypothetical protein BM549_11355 [Lacinutrix sp. MedPE-SW]